jgi:Tfp pilus assembly protein PilO
MGRLSARNQLFVAIAVIVVAAVAAVALVVVPVYRSASEMNAEIELERGNLLAAQTLLNRRQSAKAQSAANEVELMALANRIPESPQLPSVIIELQDVANASGLSFEQISVGDLLPGRAEEGQEPRYSAVPITIILHGRWADITDYFHRIDRLDRGVRVVNSTFQYVAPTDEDPSYVQASAAIEVYVINPDAPEPEPTPAPSDEASETGDSADAD